MKSKNCWLSCWLVGLSLALSLGATQARAIDNFNPVDVSGLTADGVNALLKTAAIGADHRPYRGASNLGVTLGLDIGMDVTVVKTPSEFVSAMTLITGQPASQIPELLALPRLNLHKGLPWGVDLGFSYISYQSLFKVYGAEVSWNPLRGLPGLPNLQGRLSASYASLWFMQTHAYKMDVVASKAFAVIEPYIGLGMQTWNGDLNLPVTVASGFQANVTGHAASTNLHIFGGLVLKLLVLKIAGEFDWSSAGVTSIGSKVSLAL